MEGIKAGSLFVDLGIKGGDKTVGTLMSTKKGMGEVASMSLEAKAGILAAVYGLERLMQASAQFGSSLTNFKTLTGVPTTTMQQYTYAARQVNVASEDVMGSFKALQNAMTQIDINKGLPEGLKYISGVIGGMDIKKIHDLPHMMQQFQKFATSSGPNEGMKRWALSTVGLSEGMITALESNAFRPDVFAKAPAYSEAQLASLAKVNVAWANLGNKIEMQFGKLTSKHGGQLVKDIDILATAFFNLGDALQALSEKGDVLTRIGKGAEGLANSLKLITELIDKMAGKDSKKGDILYNEPGQEALPGWKGSPAEKIWQFLTSRSGGGWEGMLRDFGLKADPSSRSLPTLPSAPGGPKVEIKQTITHVGDATDTQNVKNLHRAAAQAERNHAFRQSGANLRAN